MPQRRPHRFPPLRALRGLRVHRGAEEAGFSTTAYVLAVAMALLTFTWVANLVVMQYGRGVVRGAVDEAARAGARVDASVAECQARAAEALAGALGGTMGEGVVVACSEDAEAVRAVADVTFRSWLPPVADWSFRAVGQARKEQEPA